MGSNPQNSSFFSFEKRIVLGVVERIVLGVVELFAFALSSMLTHGRTRRAPVLVMMMVWRGLGRERDRSSSLNRNPQTGSRLSPIRTE